MQRKYKIKERRYTIEKLEEAIHKVLLREMTPSRASRVFKIPRMTIVNHVNGRSKGFRSGRQPVFTHEQEKMILEIIFSMSDMGVGLDVMSFRKI